MLIFRLKNCGIISGNECGYFEVDFPVVARTKCSKISGNRILRSFFRKYDAFEQLSSYKFDAGNFCLVGCNMTDTESLESKLASLGFDFNALTIILTECSTTYVDVGLSLQLLRWLTKKVSNFGTMPRFSRQGRKFHIWTDEGVEAHLAGLASAIHHSTIKVTTQRKLSND